MLHRSFAVAITGYQRYISPYKGFCCAHRVKHGGMSCSEYVKQALLHHGAWRSIPVIKKRFKECKMAASELNAQRHSGNGDQNRDRRQERTSILEYCDCCDLIDLIPSQGCSSLGGADACSCTPW